MLRQAAELVQYLIGGEVPLETLTCCQAETASHAAARLDGEADGCPVAVRDKSSFDEPVFAYTKEIFLCAITGG